MLLAAQGFCCFELNWGDRELQQEMIFVQTSLDVHKGCIKQTLNANACIYAHFGFYWPGLTLNGRSSQYQSNISNSH